MELLSVGETDAEQSVWWREARLTLHRAVCVVEARGRLQMHGGQGFLLSLLLFSPLIAMLFDDHYSETRYIKILHYSSLFLLRSFSYCPFKVGIESNQHIGKRSK